MAGSRIIDPSDPQSIMRMLKRIDTLEQKTNKLSASHKRLKNQITSLKTGQAASTASLRFSFSAANAFTWTTGWVTDKDGKTYPIAAGSATITGLGTTPVWCVYNIPHNSFVVLDFNASPGIDTLSQDTKNNIVVCGIANLTSGYPSSTPNLASSTFTTGAILFLGM